MDLAIRQPSCRPSPGHLGWADNSRLGTRSAFTNGCGHFRDRRSLVQHRAGQAQSGNGHLVASVCPQSSGATYRLDLKSRDAIRPTFARQTSDPRPLDGDVRAHLLCPCSACCRRSRSWKSPVARGSGGLTGMARRLKVAWRMRCIVPWTLATGELIESLIQTSRIL